MHRQKKPGYTQVVDADLQSYLDTIPKTPMLALIEEKSVFGFVRRRLRAILRQREKRPGICFHFVVEIIRDVPGP